MPKPTPVFAFLLCVVLLPAQEVTLRAGLGRVDITPSTFGPMYGYSNRRCGPANGTHDPLYAKALVLEAGQSRMAIVSLDLGSIASGTLFDRVGKELGIPLLLLAASHTHSGPAFLSRGDERSPYHSEVEQKIFDVVKQASQKMFQARLGIGRGSMQLGYNRLVLRDEGRARAAFNNLDRIPYGPVDPEFTLLRIEDAQGVPRALMVHYATHPVVLGPTSCKWSADYVGVLQAKVEEAMSGVQCMFVQGGAGDINPLFLGRAGNDDEDFATMQKMGELLAAEVLRSAKTIQPTPPVTEPIRYVTQTIPLRERWDKDRGVEVGISTVLLGGGIAIAAVPGEPFHKLQTEWKQRADVPHPLFYGYTQSTRHPWPGYIPDLRSAAYGGYGADVTTRVEIGAGEKIMERHLVNLYGLRGMWLDKPGRP